MHEELRALLNAYLDGELHGTRLMEMKLHLASCDAYRKELTDLLQVSDLLKAAPNPDFMPAERFASNLVLSLPRRQMHDLPPTPGSLAWWLVPAGLMGAWFFIQTVFALSDAALAAQTTGLLGHTISVTGSGQATAWFSALSGLIDGQAGGLQPTLSLLNGLTIFGKNLLDGFLWQALIVLLYWGWLFVWWLRRRPQQMRLEGAAK